MTCTHFLRQGGCPVFQPLPAPTFGHAAEAFVVTHAAPGAWSAGTAVKYRQTLAALGGQLAGTAPDSAADVAVLGTPGGCQRPGGRVHRRVREARPGDPRSAPVGAAFRAGLVGGGRLGDRGPTAGWARPKVPVDTTRALTRAQVASIWKFDVPLRDKALWRMLYETAARAEEILGHLSRRLPANRREARPAEERAVQVAVPEPT